MKRLANYLIAMVLMAFTFTSCEDVPNPFGQILPPDKTEDGGGSGGTTSVIKENFKEAGKVTWAINNVNVPAGAEVWTYDSKYGMKATAYIGGANNAAESWLISPAYDLSNVTGATLSIHHAANYFANGADKECAVMVSTDYKSGAPSTATWKAITIDTWPSSWTFVDGTGSMSDFDGKSNVCIALKYTSTAEKSGTWEVESIEITGGGSASGGGDTPTPSGNHGTADAPLTVAQAMALIDAESTIDEAYVKGKISQIDSYSSQYKSITYWISDDGGTTTQLEVYSGKGLNGADFAAKEDLTVGQTVVVKGKLKKYNDIYEFDKTSSIISIEGGSGGGGDTPAPTGDNLIVNGDFESWTGDAPDNWNGVAGNATLEKSTDVHGGSAALLIKSNSANKRLSYKAIKLKKGTYNISLYAKAVTGTSKIAPGYVAIINGAPDSQNYMYIETYPEVGTSWTKVEHSFTLGADTEVCLVIMKHKSTSNDVIIDDYSLTSSDGGLIDGGDTPGGGDTPAPTGAYLDESFANGKGNFTIDDKVFSGVWTAASYGSDSYMMATSYVKADGESAKTNHDAESWLISPEIDLSSATNPVLTFAQVINKFFGTIAEEAMVFAKKENGNWTKLTITYPATPSSSFSKFTDDGANVSVSLADYKSSKTQIAFVYKGSSTKAGTWEIKDVKVAEAAQ